MCENELSCEDGPEQTRINRKNDQMVNTIEHVRHIKNEHLMVGFLNRLLKPTLGLSHAARSSDEPLIMQ